MKDFPISVGDKPKPKNNLPPHNIELMAAINQVFALFEVNYSNQFYSAFKNGTDQLNVIKRLWRDSLAQFSAAEILAAATAITRESDYLPTLHTMLRHCSQASTNLPSAREAYIEACQAANPKAQQNWSSPVVYEAGRRSDWFFLATTNQRIAFPVFKNHYEALLKEINNGSRLEVPALPEKTKTPTVPSASKEEALKNIQALRKSLRAEKSE